MGTAWHESGAFPWETTRYVSGIEVVKVNIALRIYAAKWHVYAGLALLNPWAQIQIKQYAKSVTELFKLMLERRETDLADRVWAAREGVFGWKRDQEGDADQTDHDRAPILLSEDLLDQFSLGKRDEAGGGASPNSHLSLLAMVDCWNALGISPFEHLEVAGTPVFMLWIGVAEFLFRSTSRIASAISAGVNDKVHRPDDTEFTVASRGWSECVSFGNFELYQRRFEYTSSESASASPCLL